MGIKIGKHGSTGEVWDKKGAGKNSLSTWWSSIGPSREESETELFGGQASKRF